MSWLILPPDQQDALAALNAAQTDRAISPVSTADGILLIGADLLGDPFWDDYQALLVMLSPYVGDPIFLTVSDNGG
jgi:hypothetical protein